MGMEKKEIVAKLLEAKEKSGKTYDELAHALGVTNVYVAQLLRRQTQLKPATAAKLAQVLPAITPDLLKEMQKPPVRSYDPAILQEPHVYRMTEVCAHYGDGILAVLHELFGDGIMSAIDFKLDVKKVKGSQGEDRVLMVWNGKFLPHIEQTV
ncbi:cyanase [Candidatus Nitrospira bockiana]